MLDGQLMLQISGEGLHQRAALALCYAHFKTHMPPQSVKIASIEEALRPTSPRKWYGRTTLWEEGRSNIICEQHPADEIQKMDPACAQLPVIEWACLSQAHLRIRCNAYRCLFTAGMVGSAYASDTTRTFQRGCAAEAHMYACASSAAGHAVFTWWLIPLNQA